MIKYLIWKSFINNNCLEVITNVLPDNMRKRMEAVYLRVRPILERVLGVDDDGSTVKLDKDFLSDGSLASCRSDDNH